MALSKTNKPELGKEKPVAKSVTGALLWRATASVAPYFWTAVTLIVVMGWFQVGLVDNLAYITLMVFAGSCIGHVCQSDSVFMNMEYNGALTPTARNRYITQSIPGFVAMGVLVFLVVAVRYLEAPAGFLQMLGVDMESYIMSPTNSDRLGLKMLLLAVVGFLSFATSYSCSALYVTDGVSRLMAKTTGIGFVIGYLVGTIGITSLIIPDSIRTFSIFALLILFTAAHYVMGWWLVKTSSKVQHDSFFHSVFRPFWILPFALLVIFVLTFQMGGEVNRNSFNDLLEPNRRDTTHHSRDVFNAERTYRENLWLSKELEKNGADAAPDRLSVEKPPIGTGLFSQHPDLRPWSMICVLLVLGGVAFVHWRLSTDKPQWGWARRIVFALAGIALLGFCFYQIHHQDQVVEGCIDEALNTKVYYRSTPFQPKNPDFQGDSQPLDYSTLRIHLNLVLVDNISFAPLQTAVFEMEAKPEPDGMGGIFRVKPSSNESLKKNFEQLKQIDGLPFITQLKPQGAKVGYWWKGSGNGTWKIAGINNLFGTYQLSCAGIISPVHQEFDSIGHPGETPFANTPFGFSSRRKDYALISWMTLWHEGEEGIEVPLSDVLEEHGERLSFKAAQNQGMFQPFGPLQDAFRVVKNNRLLLVMGCAFLFFAWRGRWRPDGRLPLLVLGCLSVIVVGKGVIVSKGLKNLKSEQSSEASRIYSVHQLSREILKHPTIHQEIADVDSQSTNVLNSIRNLKEWTGLDPESSRLYFPSKWMHINDPMSAVRFCDWLDASDQRTTAMEPIDYVALDNVYFTKLSNNMYLPGIATFSEGDSKSLQVLKTKMNSSFGLTWRCLPEAFHWTRVEKGYYPIQTLGIEGHIDSSNLRPRNAVQLFFRVKEEYAEELNAEPESEYVLTLSSSELYNSGGVSNDILIERRPVIQELGQFSINWDHLSGGYFFDPTRQKQLMKVVMEASTKVTTENQEEKGQ